MSDKFYQKLDPNGILTLASRMKRLSELLFSQVQEVYDLNERKIKSSWFAILATIRHDGKVDFKTLASRRNISSPAISQVIKELEQHKLVKVETGSDKRSKIISLTPLAEERLDSMVQDLVAIEEVLMNMTQGTHETLIRNLDVMEGILRKKSLKSFLQLRIVDFNNKYKKDFEKLNLAWIQDEEKFELEEYDKKIFLDPKKHVIDKGGEIFLAIDGEKVVGTLAILPENESTLELCKMTVAKEYRRKGIAQMLLNKAIVYAKTHSYKYLVAYTVSKLKTAIGFYRKNNFVGSKHADERYKRIDEKFILDLTNFHSDFSNTLLMASPNQGLSTANLK